MPGVAYVNGQYVPHDQAAVHIEDRGYQFSDAIYEVWYYRHGKLYDLDGHLERLQSSLWEIGIPMPMEPRVLTFHLQRIARKNRLKEGIVYLQISRGVAPRDHAFPSGPIEPTVVITTKPLSLRSKDKVAEKGVGVITQPDLRWARRDIKSVSLLPNVLAKEAAHEAGAAEAWLVDGDGLVTEGSSTNAWIVEKADGKVFVRTRKLSHDILRGITRTTLVGLIEREGYILKEEAFTPEEAQKASEAFITSATNLVMPVVRIDGESVGNGNPGPVAVNLRKLYLEAVESAQP